MLIIKQNCEKKTKLTEEICLNWVIGWLINQSQKNDYRCVFTYCPNCRLRSVVHRTKKVLQICWKHSIREKLRNFGTWTSFSWQRWRRCVLKRKWFSIFICSRKSFFVREIERWKIESGNHQKLLDKMITQKFFDWVKFLIIFRSFQASSWFVFEIQWDD